MSIPMKMPREQKEMIISKVQMFFEEERSETIGNIAAESIVDFMIKELAPYLYNRGVEDCRKLLMQKMSQMEDEFYALEQPIR
ncbi:DUF2164 domain-containing protein [Paenibacillus guangzhouensis]|uniref:DUF2164 domain-containing protein n=1 Tax=Paenibacillus guangzhouensis TaxID=1473112 RepID=UPI001266C9AA|nr:DUF2164 domain-containing protein [Paenibacillus guangzhouensis]